MKNRNSHCHVAAILLLVGVILSWGCAGEEKPAETGAEAEAQGVPASVLADVPAAAFTAPAAPAVESSEIIAYLKVREPEKLIDRMSSWASMFPMPMSPEMLRSQLEDSGITLSELREGGNLAFFVFNPGAAFAQVPVAGIVPTADGGAISQAMRAQMGPDNVLALDNSLLFAQDIDTLSRAQAMGADLQKTADLAMAADLQLYMNMEAIMNQYGAMVRGYIPMVTGMMAMSGMPEAQLAKSQRDVEASLTMLIDMLDQLKGVTLLVDMGEDALEVATVVTAKPETTLAKILAADPLAAPDLSRFLSDGSMISSQVTYSDIAGMTKWWMKYSEKMLPADAEVDMEAIKQVLAAFSEVGRTDYAFGLGLDEAGKIAIEGVMRMEDTTPMMKFMEEKMATFNEGAIHDFYQASGMDLSVETHLNVRQIAGRPVHQYQMTLNFTEQIAPTPEQLEMMNKIIGDMQMEVIEIKPLVVYSINKPIDGIVQSLLADEGGASLLAMDNYPAGGLMYADVDVAAYMNAIQTLLPELQNVGMPVMPEGLPPLMMYGRNADSMGYYSLKIPRGLVKGLMDAATGAAQQPATPPAMSAPAEAPAI